MSTLPPARDLARKLRAATAERARRVGRKAVEAIDPATLDDTPQKPRRMALPPDSYAMTLAEFRRSGRVSTRFDLDPNQQIRNFIEFQSMYRDDDGWLTPNTEIWHGEFLLLGVNSLGCKGPEVDLEKPLIAFFGDSATMGLAGSLGATHADSWPHHVRLEGYEVVNAAIEGSEMTRVVEQYERLRELVPIACSVVYAGWHNIAYGRTGPAYWESRLVRCLSDEHPTAFCTVATPVTDEFRERGIDELLNESAVADANGDYFIFWGDLEPEEWLPKLLDGVARYNAWLHDFCARHDAHVIDLYEFLRPARYEEATRDFFDVCHPRPRAYPKIGAFVAERLREILPPAGEAVPVAVAVADAPELPEQEDLRKNLYPLW